MEQLNSIIRNVVEKIYPLLADTMIASVVKEAEQLTKSIEESRFIKVPIVGDFNSEKHHW